MAVHEIIRVEEDDPERCQSGHAYGQCRFRAFPGMKYCPIHSRAPKENLRNYDLNSFKMKNPDSPTVKSLREEIGITRAVLERKLNSCRDDTDLLLNIPVITNLVNTISDTVVKCHKVEKDLGKYVDVVQLQEYSIRIVDAISLVVSDPVVLGKIGEAILAVSDSFTNAAGLPLAKLRDDEFVAQG